METSEGAKKETESEAKLRAAKEKANQIIIEVEQYKAMVEQPKGKMTDQVISDDEFFHLTCHIDPLVRSKIETGDFVDLEKLLPKDRPDRLNEGKMDLINKDGQTYFVSAQKETKITNVRRWEQAFRIYAAIYSTANPHRAAEIWQYVYVINSAASTYVWEEVAYYDYTFRQLMAANPERSWAKTYVQMWQMALRTHLNKGNSFGFRSFQSQNQNHYSGGHSENGQKPKSKYCWKFNRNFGCQDASCKYPHKCYYCHNNHGIHVCRKKDKRGGGNNSNSSYPSSAAPSTSTASNQSNQTNTQNKSN